MSCPNCGARISCGCQRRVASDGKQCCSRCLAAYEKSKGRTIPQRTIPRPRVLPRRAETDPIFVSAKRVK